MLECHDITVRFGGRAVVDSVSFDAAPGDVVAILGPSGSGKSTLLRVIAGLQAPDAGSVVWNRADVTSTPPHLRNFGLMFQDYALFPHRTAAGNIAFGLEMRGDPSEEIRRRVADMLDIVGLTGMGEADVTRMSGGEQQRVALARTLATEPGLIMLDEPIGALDRRLRDDLTIELAQIFERLDATVLYVTHDQGEAFGLADQAIVMRDGKVVAAGAPEDLWRRPPSEFVARFLGMDSIVTADVRDGIADTGWARFAFEGASGTRRLLLRPDALSVVAEGQVEGTVASAARSGSRYELAVRVAADTVLVVESRDPASVGSEVRLAIDPSAVVPIDQPTSSDV